MGLAIFLHVDDAVPGPVDHILGGHHSQSLDPFVGVVRIRTLLITLLLVVCGIHIQPAFILDCSRVGSEVEVNKRVGQCLFKLRGSCPVSGQDGFGCLLLCRRSMQLRGRGLWGVSDLLIVWFVRR